ncbi:MAG: hypothetical protein CM1200mP3_11690 [Chloroflexota bacterium]|nr:MAG: hypothetical protein CM1200mP3_11690 [Chloroflexota bacterium]
MVNRLQGKRTIVPGGSSGIGRAICKLFASEGASLVIADIDNDGGQETLNEVLDDKGTAVFVHTDVSNAAVLKTLYRRLLISWGGLMFL